MPYFLHSQHWPTSGQLRDFRLTPETGRVRAILIFLFVAITCFAASKVAILLKEAVPQATVIWPPMGVALAALLLCGYRVAPAIFIGALLAVFAASHEMQVSVGVASGNTLAAVACTWALHRFVKFDNDINRIQDVVGIVLVSAFLGAVINASIGVLSLSLMNMPLREPPAVIWGHWWLATINGMIVITPALLVWLNRTFPVFPSFWYEALPLLTVLILLCTAIFGPWPPEEIGGKFLIFPFVILAAYRLGQYGTTLVLLTTVASIVWWLSHDAGTLGISGESLRLTQIFLATLATTGLFLGAALAERQEKEQQLQKHMRALERSNHDLDDFAYIASHDLKEPLRGINSQAIFLLEDYQGKIDQAGVDKLKRLVQLSERMNLLISDLLSYSRLGRTELAVKNVNMNKVVQQVQQRMDFVLKEKNARILVPRRLPDTVCDELRVSELFYNLVVNAIKYNDKPEKVVEIGFLAEVEDSARGVEKNVFYVKDNGVGIDKKFFQDIFRMFKRVPTTVEDKEPGTGIGLTFVKKIIERHNGTIWLQSEIGKGTTFYFTLPGGGRNE